VTNCLNFGNPMKPEIFWQFKRAIEGLGDACRSLKLPVTGGNVSFYNENPKGAVDPTPTIGMVGLIEKEEHITTQFFKDEGDEILMLGNNRQELGGSHYIKIKHNLKVGKPPRIDFDEEKRLQSVILGSIKKGFVKSAHDCSEGGLAVALAESAISSDRNKLGCTVNLDPKYFKAKRNDALLFGESQSRVVITCMKKDMEKVKVLAKKKKIGVTHLGKVGGEQLIINYGKNNLIECEIDTLGELWSNSIEETVTSK